MKKHRQTPVARAVSLLLTFAMLATLFLPAGAVGTEETAAPAAPTDSSFEPAAFDEAEYLDELFAGDDSEDAPFEINSVEQLVFLQKLANGQANEDLSTDWGAESGGYGHYFLLTADLDLSDYESWTPIGNDAEHFFGASFDGGHHTISGLTVSVSVDSGNAYAGLFGHAKGAELSNLTVKGSVSATASEAGAAAYAGGIVGYAYITDLTGCAADALTVTATETGSTNYANTTAVAGSIGSTPTEVDAPDNKLSIAYAGGVAGYDEGTADVPVALEGCSASASVTVKAISTGTGTFCGAVSGGVIGMANGVDLTGCSSAANVSFQTSKSPTSIVSYVSREPYYITSAGGVAGALLGAVEDNITSGRSSQSMSSSTYTFVHEYTLRRLTAAANCTSTATVSAVLAKTDATASLYYPAVGGVVGATSYANVTDATSSAQVSGGLLTGGVVGMASGASVISNCTTLDSTVSAGAAGGAYVGGVVGQIVRQASYVVTGDYTGGQGGSAFTLNTTYDSGTVTGCVNNGLVNGASYAGGVVGSETAGIEVSDCTNSGAVTSTGSYAGGVAGYAAGTTLNCGNTGAVSGATAAGGVYGYGAAAAVVTGCTNSGPVTGSGYVGGIGNFNGTLTGNTNTGTVTGVAGGTALYVGGILGSCYAATVNFCVNEGTVRAISGGAAPTTVAVGGLAGFANHTTTTAWQIYNSANKGNVTSTLAFTSMGGLMGIAGGAGRLYNSYSLGGVQGRADYAGGIVGQQLVNAAITNNYSAGTVSSYAAGYSIGGVAGSVVEDTGAAKVTDNYYQADTCAQAVGQEVSIGAAGTFDKATLALTPVDGETALLADDLTGALDKWVTDTSDSISLRWTLPEGETYPTFDTDTVSPADVPGVYTFSADGGATTAESFTGAYGSTLAIRASGYLSAVETTDAETGVTSVTYTDVNGTMSYQWYETVTGYPELDGTPLAGGTGAVLTVDTTVPGSRTYYVVGTNTTVFGDTASSQSQLITVTVLKDENDERYYAGDVAAFSGSGTETDPYIIESGANLAYLAQQVNIWGNTYEGKYFKQTTDIDLNNQLWTPIGTVQESSTAVTSIGGVPFSGIYDGADYKITNLKITGTPDPAYNSANSVFVRGLFNYTSGATIKNLTLESGTVQYIPENFSGSSSKMKKIALGALVGVASDTTIESCANVGVTIPMDVTRDPAYTYIYLGGLAGYLNGSTMKNCSNSVDLKMHPTTGVQSYMAKYVGGLAGYGGTYIGCVNSGAIQGEFAGGITGYIGTFTDCRNSGAITGFYIGGISGYSDSLTDCSNSGAIIGLHNSGNSGVNCESAGGIVGRLTGTALNCANTGAVSGYISGGIAGALYSSTAVIANSYNTGAVTGGVLGEGQAPVSGWDGAAGGICGHSFVSNSAANVIVNSYNTGTVTNQTEPSSSTGNIGAIIGYYYGSSGFELTIQDCYYTGADLTACGGFLFTIGSTTAPTVNVLAVGTISEDGKVAAAEGTALDFSDLNAEGNLVQQLNCWASANLAAYPAAAGWKAGTENAPAVLMSGDESMTLAADFTVSAAMNDEDGVVSYGDSVTLTASMDYGENEGEKGTVTWQWYRSTAETTDPDQAIAIEDATSAEYTFNATDAGTWYYFAVASNTYGYSRVSHSTTPALKLTVSKAESDAKWYGAVADSYAGGDGTQGNPYQIVTPEQLAYLASQVNNSVETSGKYYVLTNNIDASNWEWTSIGALSDSTYSSVTIGSSFQGTLDGGGHTVTIRQNTTQIFGGLFGALENATVYDLTVDGAVTAGCTGSSYMNPCVGAVASVVKNSTLTNVTNKAAVAYQGNSTKSSYYVYIGGVFGKALEGSTLTNVVNEGTVTLTGTCYTFRLGGVAGSLNQSTVTDGANTGAVTVQVTYSTNSYTGGVIGELLGSTLDYCRNSGRINAVSYVGGLTGYAAYVANAAGFTIQNSWNKGELTSNSRTGGLIGYSYTATAAYPMTISNCYNTGDIAGSSTSSGLIAYLYRSAGTISNCYHSGAGVSYGLIGTLSLSTTYRVTMTNCFALAGENPPVVTNTYLTQDSVGTFTDVNGAITAANGTTLLYDGTLQQRLNGWCLDNEADYVWVVGEEGYPVLAAATDELLAAMTDAAVPVLTDENAEAITLIKGATEGNTLTVAVSCTAYTPGEGDEGTKTAVGTVTYQWYQRLTDPSTGSETVLPVENASGTLEMKDGSAAVTFTIPTGTAGFVTYYLVVTNRTDYTIAAAVSGEHSVIVRASADDATWYGGSTAFAKGDGTEENPYQIATPEQLAFLMEQVNAGGANAAGTLYAECRYQVMNDIDVSNSAWTPIGTSANPFKGVFDGNGKTITLKIDSTLTNQALFGYSSGTIQSLTVAGSVTAGTGAAGVVYQNSGTVDGCVNKAAVFAGTSGGNTGGIAGYNSGVISNCINEGAVKNPSTSSSSNVGGIVGYNYSGTVENCTNRSGDLDGYFVGGVVGDFFLGGTVRDCVNEADISVADSTYCRYLGGIVGYANTYSGSVSITDCTNRGDLESNKYAVGGIVGNGSYVKISGCVNEGTLTTHGSGASSSYSAGGIGSSFGSSSTVVLCVNNGDIIAAADASASVTTGGIAGVYSTNTSVSQCVNNGDITYLMEGSGAATYAGAGGIIGSPATSTPSITACVNNGDISAAGYAGGILGYDYASSTTTLTTITDCINNGSVANTDSSEQLSGGLVGYVRTSIGITNSYSAGQAADGGVIGQDGTAQAVVTNSYYVAGTAPTDVGVTTFTYDGLAASAAALAANLGDSFVNSGETVSATVTITSGDEHISAQVGGETATGVSTLTALPTLKWIDEANEAAGDDEIQIPSTVLYAVDITPVTDDGYTANYAMVGENVLTANSEGGYTVVGVEDASIEITLYSTAGRTFTITADKGVIFDVTGANSLGEGSYSSRVTDTVTFTVAVADGYVLDGVTADGAALKAVKGVYTVPADCQSVEINATKTYVVTVSIKHADVMANQLINNDDSYTVRVNEGITFTIDVENGCVILEATANGVPLSPDENGDYGLPVTEDVEIIVTVKRAYSGSAGQKGITEIIDSVAGNTQTAEAVDSTYDDTLDYNDDEKNDLLDILEILYRQKAENAAGDTPAVDAPAVDAPADGE